MTQENHQTQPEPQAQEEQAAFSTQVEFTAQPAQDTPEHQQQAELQRLMQLPLTEIDKLPQEQQELVWQELAKQIQTVVVPEKVQEALDNIYRKTVEMSEPVQKAFSTLKEAFSKLGTQWTIAAMKRSANNTQTTFNTLSHIHALLSYSQKQAEQIYKKLYPYINKEIEEHQEKYGWDAENPATIEELLSSAATKAREAGEYIPTLIVELSEEEKNRRRHIHEAAERRELARQEGTVDVTSTDLAIIANTNLGFSYFTSEVIKTLPGGVDMQSLMLDKDGKINLYDLTQGGKPTQEVLKEVDFIHTSFLMWLLGLAYNNSDLRETNSSNAIIPVYIPAVLNEMKIDPRPRERQRNKETNKNELVKRQEQWDMAELRREKFMSLLNPFLTMAAFFGDDLYQIVGFSNYIKETETVYLTIPYLFRLVEYSKLNATKHGAIVNIFHADIMTENQTAVEVANRIAMGVVTRGLRPDAKTYKRKDKQTAKKEVQQETIDKDGNKITIVSEIKPRTATWSPKFSIINDCPQLQKELDAIRNRKGDAEQAVLEAAKQIGKEPDKKAIENARKADRAATPQKINNKLRDIFGAAYRIIMEKSDMPQYYVNFTIRTGNLKTFKAPTSSTLNTKLIITHRGKNPHYHEQ